MKLLFTGVMPVTFPTVGLEVQPGDEFEVADDLAPGFLARADVEAPPPDPPRRRPSKSSAAPTGGVSVSGPVPDAPAPAEEVSRGISDDH